MPTLLLALGCKIPLTCMTFESKDHGISFMEGLGFQTKIGDRAFFKSRGLDSLNMKEKSSPYFMGIESVEEDGIWVRTIEFDRLVKERTEGITDREQTDMIQDQCEEELGDRAFHKIPTETFFTRYYGGCGDIRFFMLLEVDNNTPFLHWDLD